MSKKTTDNISKVNAQLTHEERVQSASRAGKASVEAKRKRKTFREGLEWLLNYAELSPALKAKMESEGVPTEEMNHMMVILRSLVAKAEAGDVAAYNAIIAQIGEKPADKFDLGGSVSNEVFVRYIGEKGDDVFPSSEAEVDAER